VSVRIVFVDGVCTWMVYVDDLRVDGVCVDGVCVRGWRDATKVEINQLRMYIYLGRGESGYNHGIVHDQFHVLKMLAQQCSRNNYCNIATRPHTTDTIPISATGRALYYSSVRFTYVSPPSLAVEPSLAM
jgi:hypothetical protein